jgi:hypothetical protein
MPGQSFIPRIGFEPTITVFERAKTFLALYRAASVIGDYVVSSSDNVKW